MGRKPTLPIVVTNEAIKKTAEVIRGFRGGETGRYVSCLPEVISDSAVELALFVNRQAGLLGFDETHAALGRGRYGMIEVTTNYRDLWLHFTINSDETIDYVHELDRVEVLNMVGLNLKQAIDELKKVAPHGRR